MLRTIICDGCRKELCQEHPLQRYHNRSCQMKAYRRRKFAMKQPPQKP